MIALALAALAIAQPVPPELSHKRSRVDPVLPESVRPPVERAAEAELDPKRGPGNALEILKAERAKVAGNAALEQAIDLRIAAVMLRTRFLQRLGEKPENGYRQALSTFCRLDLTEPGLGDWIERTIAAIPAGKAALGDKKQRLVAATVAVQGSGLDREQIFAQLKKGFAAAGVELVRPKGSEPSFLLRFAGTEARDEGGKATVRVTLDLSEQPPGKKTWRQSMFRTMEAADMAHAVSSAVDWLVRIGGRELLFHWLEIHGLEGIVYVEPGLHDHDHPPEPKAPPIR